jgi:hypothetical protein
MLSHTWAATTQCQIISGGAQGEELSVIPLTNHTLKPQAPKASMQCSISNYAPHKSLIIFPIVFSLYPGQCLDLRHCIQEPRNICNAW